MQIILRHQLQAITIKLNSAVPHSMADEQTMSVVMMVNTAQWNQQKVGTVMAMTQVRGYYCNQQEVSTIKHSHVGMLDSCSPSHHPVPLHAPIP
jgi:hypothetical protein